MAGQSVNSLPGAPAAGGATGSSRGRLLDRPGLALTVIVTCYMMVGIDATIVNIALPHIQAALHFSSTSLAWVLNAYLLAFGGLLLCGGRAGDILGRRRVLIAGTLLFTVASLAGGLAVNAGMLVAARAFQGVGAALAAPGTMALIATNFPGDHARHRALGIYSLVAGTGASLGLVLGGLLTQYASWRWVQFVNVPIGLAVVGLAPLCIREPERHPGRIDVLGTITGSAAILSLVYGFIRASTNGWGDSETIASFAAAVVLFAAFVVAENRSAAPMVPFRLFAVRNRTAAYLDLLVTTATILGVFYFISQFLQEVLGFSAVKAGLAFLPMTVAMFAVTRLVSRLVGRVGAKPLLVTGSLLLVGTTVWLSQISSGSSYAGGVLGPLILFGLGAGCTIMPANTTVLAGVPPREAGAASGVSQTMMQLGSALGLAVLVTIFGTSLRDAGAAGTREAISEGVRGAFTGSVAFGVAAALITIFLLTSRKPATQSAPSRLESGKPVASVVQGEAGNSGTSSS
jgi:EmrB/QacA subfamily drug resistance transporter